MFTRWNWRQAGLFTKPLKSERRRQKDRERMTKFNNKKRMEFETTTRKTLEEVVSKLDIVFQVCLKHITNLVDSEITKQLEFKLNELKGQINFQQQPGNEDKKEEHSDSLKEGASVNAENKAIRSTKSNRKKKK